MDVSGSGKPTVARAPGTDFGLADGDDLHSAKSVVEMQGGNVRDDANRGPVLDRIVELLAAPDTQATPARGRILSCWASKQV